VPERTAATSVRATGSGAWAHQIGVAPVAETVTTSVATAHRATSRSRRDATRRLSIFRLRVASKDIFSTPEADASFAGMSTALLLAEPEPDTRSFLQRHLADDGFEVVGATAGGEALELVERARPDLVLVGSSLPDASGLELCARLREGEPGRFWDRDVPVILLGAGTDPLDRVRAFARGCDDVVSEPFDYQELLARIRAVLRRTAPPERELLVAGEIVVDRPTRRVTVCGVAVTLSGKEFELLAELASDPERVFTKDELLREVWGFRAMGRTRTLDSHASRLRRKLGAVDGRAYVVNVWGVGYRLLDGEET
jgi:DNA-binding response OmpR family regulator